MYNRMGCRGGGGVVAPSFGTHCETDPKSGSGDKQRQEQYPYILEKWDICKGACFNFMDMKRLT